MDPKAFDSLQSLLDAFIKLSHKLPAGLINGAIKSIEYSQLNSEDVPPTALNEIHQTMELTGVDAAPSHADICLSGRVLWVLANYQLSIPLVALSEHQPTHPIFTINEQDKREYSGFIQSFCDAICAPDVDLNDPNDRRVMAPLFTMGCAFLGIGKALGLGAAQETQVMQHMLVAMHQSGVLEP